MNGTLILDQIAAPHRVGTDASWSVVHNGTFSSAGGLCAGSEFYAGEEFGAWQMESPLTRRASVMRLWSADQSPSHCLQGHSAVLSGTMTQTLATQPHQSYRLTYNSHSHRLEPDDSSSAGDGDGGGSVGDVLIDAVVVQTFVTPSGTDAVAHETYFTARSSETLLSFSVVGQTPFALQNVSATRVDLAAFDESDMLGVMLGA